MSQDKKQSGDSASPSSLIGKRFGGFRDDMVKVVSGPHNTPINLQEIEEVQADQNFDQEEYKKIIDTRSIEEIEAENEKLEKIVAPRQDLRPENELTTKIEPEIEAPQKQPQITSPHDQEKPGQLYVAKNIGTDTTKTKSINPEPVSKLNNPKEADYLTNPEQSKKDDTKYEVTTMPPKTSFKFKKLEWYWHIIKIPSLGLALVLGIIYTLLIFIKLPSPILFIFDVLGIFSAVYTFFLVARQIVKVRCESKSQATVAGFLAGLVVGFILAFLKLIYIWQIWTLLNMIIEPILTSLFGGLLGGLASLFYKQYRHTKISKAKHNSK